MLKLNNVTKKYFINNNDSVLALNNVNVTFKEGKFYGIIGHSGSGKSTLINILGLIDNFDEGNYHIDKLNVNDLSEDDKTIIRMQKFGFVFQTFYLNSKLTALENVILPMIVNKNIKISDRKSNALKLLKMVGLEDRVSHKPTQLSGGEQQRVAIARAIANNPEIIIADEPTGNLDKKNELLIFELLKSLVKKQGKTVIVVTHNDIIKKYADVIYNVEFGRLKNDEK